MSANVQTCIDGFLAHQRALGRKYRSEEATLRLLARFAVDRHITRGRRVKRRNAR